MNKLHQRQPLFLPKCVIERHNERPDEIVERGTLDCRDHDGRGHARIELDVGHRRQFTFIDSNRCDVVRIVGFWISQAICRYLDDVAMNNRGNALLVGSQMYLGPHVRLDIADVLDRDLCLDDQ